MVPLLVLLLQLVMLLQLGMLLQLLLLTCFLAAAAARLLLLCLVDAIPPCGLAHSIQRQMG